MQSRSRATIGVLLLALLSAALRFAILRSRPLWFDELFTFWAARLPLRELLAALRFDSGPPGFYLLEKPFALLADRLPHADAWIRVPSFLAALALFGAARTLPAGSARALFVALASGATLVNLYSAEARPYGVLGLAALALFLLSLRGAETPRRLAATALLAAAALYTHYLALFVVGALVLLSMRARRWRSALALSAGAAAFLPWVPTLRAQPDAAVGWLAEPFAASASGVLSALGGVGRVPGPFDVSAPPLLFFAGAAVGAAGLVLLLAASRRDSRAAQSAAFVVLVLGGAFLVGVWKPIVFAGRTETAVLPVWIWGLAACAPTRRLTLAVGVLAAGLGFLTTAGVVLSPRTLSTPAAVAESLSRAAAPGDVVLASGAFYLPARLASERGALRAQVRPLPAELAAHPGWFVPAIPARAEEELVDSALAGLRPGGRLFLVLPPPYETDGIARVLARSGETRTLVRSRDAVVTLWMPSPPTERPAPSER